MVFRDIERIKIIKLRLDFRTVGDLEAEPGEDVLDLVFDDRDRMEMPERRRRTGRGHVNPFLLAERGGFDTGFRFRERRLERPASRVRERSDRLLFFRREILDPLQDIPELALPPEVFRLKRAQNTRILRFGERAQSYLRNFRNPFLEHINMIDFIPLPLSSRAIRP